MALPNPGIIRTELSQMDSKKQEMLAARSGLKRQIAEVRAHRNELDQGLQQIYKELESPELPDQLKSQLQEQLTLIRNRRLSIDQHIQVLHEQLKYLEDALSGIDSGITVRKEMLSKIAVAMVQRQNTTQSNREQGRIKG